MSEIFLVAGLGNPGVEYDMTRHNCGFLVVDELAKEFGVNYWKSQDGCIVGIGSLGGDDIILAKPQSYMNRSGGPLSHLMKRYEASSKNILVVHDDMDIPQNSIRFKYNGGHGGHNGVRSICEAIGKEFARLKIGIGRPPGKMCPADYVLQKVSKSSQQDFLSTINLGSEAVLYAIENGLDKAMLKYHTA